MSTVYILGAGASKSYTGSKTGVQPPLAFELFSIFNKLRISEDRHVRIGDIITYVRDTRGVDEWEFMNWNENIEDFLTEVEQKLMALYSQYKHRIRNLPSEINAEFIHLQKVYDRMIFLFSCILNEIQNGDLYPEYKKIISNSKANDTFITFNWDTLIDQALYETGKWYVEDGYSVPFKAVFRDGWDQVELQHLQKRRSHYNLLKLHGSTNWLIPYYSFKFDLGKWGFLNPRADEIRRPVYVFHYATKAYKTYDNRSRAGYGPFSYFYYPPDIPIGFPRTSVGRRLISMGLYPDVSNYGIKNSSNHLMECSMPLIVPPVKNKNYAFLEGILESLWSKSEKCILSCEQLIIIGYRFPLTDTRAWSLLDAVVKRRKKDLPKIVIVDPYPEGIKKRFDERYPELTSVMQVQKKTIKEYLN